MASELGNKVHKHLLQLGIETPFFDFKGTKDDARTAITKEVYDVLASLGLNLSDDSLRDTPKRVAKMYCDEIFTGLNYDNFPECTSISNGIKYDEMILCKASVVSLCEHHLVPFQGVAHVAYIPNSKVIGLSKINRIVDFFSRRPQVQERLTVQICETLKLVLETEDVAVVISAEHLCVKLRGIKDQLSSTTTSKMSGKFFSVPSLRGELLALLK